MNDRDILTWAIFDFTSGPFNYKNKEGKKVQASVENLGRILLCCNNPKNRKSPRWITEADLRKSKGNCSFCNSAYFDPTHIPIILDARDYKIRRKILQDSHRLF